MYKLKYAKDINVTYGLIKYDAGGCEINEKPLRVIIEIETLFLAGEQVAEIEMLESIITKYDHSCLSSFFPKPNMEILSSRLYDEIREKFIESYIKEGLGYPKMVITLIGENKTIEYSK
jgi:hypothetical protein